MMTEDAALLRSYAETGSEDDFSELVRRNVDLVHSFAMRRGGYDAHLAAEVTQNVFISLAQNAPKLHKHPVLTGWLYAATKNAILNAKRSEKNQARYRQELTTMYETHMTPEPAVEVPGLKERLMDQLDELNDKEREAVLLRFFQGWQFNRIGEALRITEDAARMRVDRALGRIRISLEERGITSSAGALATALSAQAAGFGAPPLLVSQVTRAALSAGSASHLATNSLFLASSAHIISAISTAIVLFGLGGVALYFHSESRTMQEEIARITVERTELNARTQRLNAARMSGGIAVGEIGRSGQTGIAAGGVPAPAVMSEAAVASLADDVALLKARLETMPELKIPEIALLADKDWEIIAGTFPPRTEAQYLSAFRSLRDRARVRFALLAVQASIAYAAANDDRIPDHIDSLAPYFPPGVDEAILRRYAILQTGKLSLLPKGSPLIGELSGVVDSFRDSVVRIGSRPEDIQIKNGDSSTIRVQRAINAYMAINKGVSPLSAADLRDYLDPDLLPAAAKQVEAFRSEQTNMSKPR